MISALLYVSQSTLLMPQDAGHIPDIIAVARSRNAQLGVTGALVFTEKNFAQFLEGPQSALDELMHSIRADPRHKDVDVALSEPAPARRFEGWDMAYAGPASFVKRRVEPLVVQAADAYEARRKQAVTSIIRMMTEFIEQR